MKILINLRSTCLLLAALALAFSSAFAAEGGGTAFSKLVVFGDSLNNTGNLFRLTNGNFPNAPDYVNGRQTNGPVWVEYLADDLGLANRVINRAVVGALTKPIFLLAANEITGNVWSDTFPRLEHTDVFSQVTHYARDCHGRADPEALYILEGGGNDISRVANPSVIVSNLLDSFLALEKIGAKHILVVNLPDFGKVPAVTLGMPGSAAAFSALSAQLNQALAGAVASATGHGVRVTFADLYGFMNKVVLDPGDFGLIEVQLPWLLAGGTADPDTWLFWDLLHPTTRGHEIFSDQVLEELIKTYGHHLNGFDRDGFPCHRHQLEEGKH